MISLFEYLQTLDRDTNRLVIGWTAAIIVTVTICVTGIALMVIGIGWGC